MARLFAAEGRDLALVARRVDRLDALATELRESHPGITVVTAALDVTEHDRVFLSSARAPSGWAASTGSS